MAMDGMRRKPNFSLDEKLFLVNYIKEHKSLHDEFDPYGTDLTKSLNGWSEISNAFESHFPSKTPRDPTDLRSCWKRIRDKARCIYAPQSTPLSSNKKHLTKPKWLEKKKPIPNIVSKLAWEFMVEQEGNTPHGSLYKGQNDTREWPQQSEANSYDQMHSANSPELLLVETDDNTNELAENNDVIRIKKEWIEDEAENKDLSENVDDESSETRTSQVRKDVMPKIMMVESLQSESRRSLEIPEDTNDMDEDIYDSQIETNQEDSFQLHHHQDQMAFQRSSEDIRPYLENRSQSERSMRSTTRNFSDSRSRRGSSGQHSESLGYIPIRQEQDKTMMSTGFRPSQGHASGFRSGNHESEFVSLQEDRLTDDQLITTSRPTSRSQRQTSLDSRNVVQKRKLRSKVAVNTFDRRQSKYYQGMRHRRSRNFLARRERALGNSRQTVQEQPELPCDDIPSPPPPPPQQVRSQNAWRVRNTLNESNLEVFEETAAKNMSFQRKRPISDVYCNHPSHSASAAPIMEVPENRSFNKEINEDMLKMAQEEHNIKMQIHKRKLRVLMLKQWSLEQECIQAGYDLPPDYY
ncbi:uncharacterized protein [Antedon mediterranea]|uniref:uncharacterized protein n=1 Tax=Antedon mediterranea TaxID=105859 RepID=UPI003AF4BF17